MRVVTGRVVDGRIELPPGVFDDGESVAIVGREADEPAALDPEQERELTEAIEAIARGEYIDAEELLQRLKQRHAG